MSAREQAAMTLETKNSVCSSVVGPGEVGSRPAVALDKRGTTVGFEINAARIAERIARRSSPFKVEQMRFKRLIYIRFTNAAEDISGATVDRMTFPDPGDLIRIRRPAPTRGGQPPASGVIKANDLMIEAVLHDMKQPVPREQVDGRP